MEKKYITEIAWSQIFNFLKTIKKINIGKEDRCRKFIEAIFWMARSGAQWRILPESYGKWNSIFSRFNAWSRKYIWNKLLGSVEFLPQSQTNSYKNKKRCKVYSRFRRYHTSNNFSFQKLNRT